MPTREQIVADLFSVARRSFPGGDCLFVFHCDDSVRCCDVEELSSFLLDRTLTAYSFAGIACMIPIADSQIDLKCFVNVTDDELNRQLAEQRHVLVREAAIERRNLVRERLRDLKS